MAPSSHGRMQYELVNPVTDCQWDKLVQCHSGSTPFHTQAWAKTLVNAYGHTPHYLQVRAQGGMTALVPLMEVNSLLRGRRGVCLPFTDTCGPLLFSGCNAADVIEGIRQIGKKRRWRYFELRSRENLIADTPRSSEYCQHKVVLGPDLSGLYRNFASSTRRAIRKAEHSELVVSFDTSIVAMKQYYRLHCITRKRHGLPSQPFSFFLSLLEFVIRCNYGMLVLAKSGSRAVAGAIFLQFNQKAIYKYGASDEVGRQKRANNLLFWEAIKALGERGCISLDFGRTALKNEGLRKFKRAWGADEEKISYCRFDLRTNNWVENTSMRSLMYPKVFSRLPVWLNRAIGSILYPQVD